MAISFHLPLLLLLSIGISSAVELLEVLDDLNERIGFSTNVFYNPEMDPLQHLQSNVSHVVISSLHNPPLDPSTLIRVTNEKVLFVLIVSMPPLELFQLLYLHYDESDFLLVIRGWPGYLDVKTWLQLVNDVWNLGFLNLLLWHDSTLYDKELFPVLKLQPSSVDQYVASRGLIKDMHGYPVRVAVYSNPPRALVYKDRSGNYTYGGYYLKFIVHFLASINATFVPFHTPSYSAGHCKKALLSNHVDICGDSLAQETVKTFASTNPLRLAYANVMVPHAKPLGSYRYLAAPFRTTVWICLVLYVGIIVCFLSIIHWQQQRRWIFSKFLLEAISSLLLAGFHLRDLQGRERYILFMVLFITGFIFSTFYLGYLKSILTTEVFEDQINTFEQLIEANITILMDEYDKNLTKRYKLPDILWPLVKVVSDETLTHHRTNFNQEYAYILFFDRQDIYNYAQKYLKHPRIRRIPINIFFLYGGFPMQETWFLKNHMNVAWRNAFASGLGTKLILDADDETMTSSVGFLEFLITEYYEAQPLGHDYFVMPAMSLALGYGFAFITFVIELTAWRTDRRPAAPHLDMID